MDWIIGLAAPVITGLVTLCGIVLANRKADAVRDAKEEMKDAALSERLDRIEGNISDLSETVKEHNNYARLFQETAARLDERTKALERG